MKNQLLCISLSLFGSYNIGSATEFQSEYISVETLGSGPDVILIPGLASSPEVWSATAAELKPKYRLHLVRISGFAGAPAPKKAPHSYVETIRDEIARYIDVQELKEPVLVGHSMGGLTALLVAGKEGANVGQIVVVDSLPFFSLLYNPFATAEMVAPLAAVLETQLATMNDEAFKTSADSSASILSKSVEKRSELKKWIATSDRKAYAQCTREVMTYDARTKLKLVSCPVTVIYACDEDMPIPKQQLEMLYKSSYEGLKDVKLVQVTDSYHFIMWDNPKDFIRSLSEVLARPDDSN